MTPQQLLVIVDATAAAWAAIEASPPETGPRQMEGRRLGLAEFTSYLSLFLASFAALNRQNRLAVLAYHTAVGGGFLWPPKEGSEEPDTMLRPAAVSGAVARPLLDLRRRAPSGEEVSAQSAMSDEASASSSGGSGAGSAAARADGSSSPRPVVVHTSAPPRVRGAAGPLPGAPDLDARFDSLPSCLSLAVCHHHATRERLARAGEPLAARVLVVQAGADDPAQYVPFINAVHSCRRFNVTIDSLLVGAPSSVFLQQASSLTRGQHLHPRPYQHPGLHQIMTTAFLPDMDTRRGVLALPPLFDVDLRATCFCHRRHVRVAWVCSTCLSVACAAAKACEMCGAAGELVPTEASSGGAESASSSTGAAAAQA